MIIASASSRDTSLRILFFLLVNLFPGLRKPLKPKKNKKIFAFVLPQPQSARLRFMRRPLVSADFTADSISATGGNRRSSRSLNRRGSASCGDRLFRLISPPIRFPPQAGIGGSPAASIGAAPLHAETACFG
jgi:hypothetical protein